MWVQASQPPCNSDPRALDVSHGTRELSACADPATHTHKSRMIGIARFRDSGQLVYRPCCDVPRSGVPSAVGSRGGFAPVGRLAVGVKHN